MMQNAAEMQCSVAFLDPQVFTATVISHQPSTVTQAIKNAMKNDYVVGAYNTGGHWVTVIISMKYKEVWYLDSAKLFPGRKFTDVRHIVNWAFDARMEEMMKANKKRPKTKPKLTHRIDVKCAQQPSGTFLCGFYVAFNMLRLVGDIPIMKKAADFNAALTVSIEDLKPVREMLCEFILKETLDPKGNFYSAF
ncbi:hypothetical protein PAHAL_5G392800 [Panicum hallii]|uniref:Ubiquitin-like protease family profile domain-containing protein n=1 Tax=Panicum hallii TaxID=206008 RepID=A0A2T8IMT1_9POAL|nr:hypothetical protein PAHAL_5G106500 [Panicum hallii]PVH38936.1 hypothetical protein PAHAL_5G392800 [Panicum hallii]